MHPVASRHLTASRKFDAPLKPYMTGQHRQQQLNKYVCSNSLQVQAFDLFSIPGHYIRSRIGLGLTSFEVEHLDSKKLRQSNPQI